MHPVVLISFLTGTLACHRGYSFLASDLNGFHYPDFKCGGDRKSFNFECRHFWKLLIRAPSIIKKNFPQLGLLIYLNTYLAANMEESAEHAFFRYAHLCRHCVKFTKIYITQMLQGQFLLWKQVFFLQQCGVLQCYTCDFAKWGKKKATKGSSRRFASSQHQFVFL